MNTDDQHRICFDAASGLGYFYLMLHFFLSLEQPVEPYKKKKEIKVNHIFLFVC